MTDDFAIQTPPNDLNAEKSLLGSILLNSKVLDEIADKIKEDFFYDKRHKIVYKIMLQLYANSKPIDILFVLDALKSSPGVTEKEAEVIDREFLLELISKSSMASSPKHTAEVIKDKFMLRSLVEASDKIKGSVIEGKTGVENLLDLAQKEIYNISIDNLDKDFSPLYDLLTERFERVASLSEGDLQHPAVPTGFHDLDSILGGLHSSDLIILAARPSMGKTSFALELMKRVAMGSDIGVAIFSLEMSKEQLVDKLISSTAGVSLKKIRQGEIKKNEYYEDGETERYDDSGNDMAKLGQAIGKLNECPIWIDDSGHLNITELRTKARRLKSRHNIGLIVIDYLQLMSGGGDYRGNRVQEVSDISRNLKMLAKELDVPIIALSQLSRGVEGRDDKRPMLSDLRESGSIEQDADIVMFVHREEMYNRESKKKGIADILISKHRNGETGAIELAWVGHLATFENLQGAKIGHRINK